MKKILFAFVLIVALIFGISVLTSAQDSVAIYNKNEEVALSHEPFYYYEQYYLHIDDLPQLGLDVIKEDGKYTISSSDCLGVYKKVVLSSDVNFDIDDGPIIIEPPILLFSSEVEPVVEKCRLMNVVCQSRATKYIGNSIDSTVPPLVIVNASGIADDEIIKVNDELYISVEFVGRKLSYGYSTENGRVDFYIADDTAVITNATIYLAGDKVAPSGGMDIKVYTAYKTGDGNTIEDFEVLSELTCTIAENEKSVSCFIETPAEKINDKNIYFIVDYGDRYRLLYDVYDFSVVGSFCVCEQQKDITYTVNVTLPEPDEKDVSFAIYVYADRVKYSKQGVVKSGEKTVTVDITELPVTEEYEAWIEFDYHKYKDAVLKDFDFFNIKYAKDFKTDFTAEYSRKAICTVSLPDGYNAGEDVIVQVKLTTYYNSSLAIVDSLTDWNDSVIVTLDNENPSEQICLYSQAQSSKLSYTIISGLTEELCEKGWLGKNGKTVNDKDSAKVISEDIVADMCILMQNETTESRPIRITAEYPYSGQQWFLVENISESTVNDFNVYIVRYDTNGKMISVEITEVTELASGCTLIVPVSAVDAKAFAWKKDSLIPLGNIATMGLD